MSSDFRQDQACSRRGEDLDVLTDFSINVNPHSQICTKSVFQNSSKIHTFLKELSSLLHCKFTCGVGTSPWHDQTNEIRGQVDDSAFSTEGLYKIVCEQVRALDVGLLQYGYHVR